MAGPASFQLPGIWTIPVDYVGVVVRQLRSTPSDIWHGGTPGCSRCLIVALEERALASRPGGPDGHHLSALPTCVST
jgi:hypothetical protein